MTSSGNSEISSLTNQLSEINLEPDTQSNSTHSNIKQENQPHESKYEETDSDHSFKNKLPLTQDSTLSKNVDKEEKTTEEENTQDSNDQSISESDVQSPKSSSPAINPIRENNPTTQQSKSPQNIPQTQNKSRNRKSRQKPMFPTSHGYLNSPQYPYPYHPHPPHSYPIPYFQDPQFHNFTYLNHYIQFPHLQPRPMHHTQQYPHPHSHPPPPLPHQQPHPHHPITSHQNHHQQFQPHPNEYTNNIEYEFQNLPHRHHIHHHHHPHPLPHPNPQTQTHTHSHPHNHYQHQSHKSSYKQTTTQKYTPKLHTSSPSVSPTNPTSNSVLTSSISPTPTPSSSSSSSSSSSLSDQTNSSSSTMSPKDQSNKSVTSSITKPLINKAQTSSTDQEKSNYRQQQQQQQQQFQDLDYLIVLDFEATCDEGESPVVTRENQEIIEFPWVVVDVKKRKIIDERQIYVKPVELPQQHLPAFCTQLTGITDQKVFGPGVPNIKLALDSFCSYIHEHFDVGGKKYMLVTDGEWDIAVCLYGECQRKDLLPLPKPFLSYFELKSQFARAFPTFPFRPSLSIMLRSLGLKQIGRKHSGLDDSRSIAQVVIHLLEVGHMFMYPKSFEDLPPDYRDFNLSRDQRPPTKVVQLRGLPWTSTHYDVQQFFLPKIPSLRLNQIHIMFDAHGRHSGLALVYFDKPEDVELALTLHRQYLGSRWIEVYPHHATSP